MSQSASSLSGTHRQAATWPIGRESDLAVIRWYASAGARLITLAGPGGVGKTCLAIAAALEQREAFAGDVTFVDCAAVQTASQIIPAVVGALGLDRGGPVSLEHLTALLRDRELLLVLDNLEQIDGAGDLIAELLARTQRSVVLATTRIRLGIATERVVMVEPLPVGMVGNDEDPERDLAPGPAVELFAARAVTAWPSFRLTSRNQPDVVAICRRLDGLPLAIELAAARVSILSPAAMLSRIERQFTLTGASRRDLPDRHRSLDATLSWSYDLLSATEQRRFRTLAVFDGSFDQGAAAAVWVARELHPESGTNQVEPVDRWLMSLEHQSLLVRQPGPGGREAPRFVMMETVRAYARLKLEQDPEHTAVQERHTAWFLALAAGAEPELNGAVAVRWFERLDQELANLRRALSRAITSDRAGDGLTMAVALWRYWETRGLMQEGVATLERLLALDSARTVGPALRGRALNHLANLLTDLGAYRRAAGLYEESLALRRRVGDPGPVADTLNNLGLVSLALGDMDGARQQFREALVIRQARSDRWGEALALSNLGDVEIAVGAAGPAIDLHQRALAIRSEIGDERGIAFGTSNLAEACRLAGDRARAGELLAQAADQFRRLGLPFGEALVRRNQGDLLDDEDADAAALRAWHEALIGFDAIGDRGRLAEVQERLGETLIRVGAVQDGLTLLGAAERLREETGVIRLPIDEPRFEAAMAAARTGLDATVLAAALAIGRAMSMEAVAELVARAVESVDVVATTRTSPVPMRAPTDQRREPRPSARLTDRERDVLDLLAEGLTNAEIAGRLSVSVYTVNAHLRRIYRHLGVRNRTAAVERWVREA